jgi:hypothetical protein
MKMGVLEKIENLIPGPMIQRNRRILVTLFAILSAVFILSSYFFPYWKFTLIAPQYPQGLRVQVYLSKLKGDVSELDILNHYIGMKKMEEAAQFERKIALFGIIVLSLFSLFFSFLEEKVRFFVLPSLAFPLIFIGDLFFWMYRFGHELDPNAPIKITPFTPKILGEGIVAQFKTYATFGLGFYLAILGFIFVFLAFVLRIGVCNACPVKEKCSVFCPNLPKWPGKPEEFERAGMKEKALILRQQKVN